MGPLFGQVTVIGVGLLGGSLGLACRAGGLAGKVVGHGRRMERVRQAQALGILDAAEADLKAALKDADLVVLCPPVLSIVPLAKEVIPLMKPGSILTDVGSVKGGIVRDIEAILPKEVHFVGSHPIAGGEKSGFEESRADLYRGALCIVTRSGGTDSLALDKVGQFWERMGGNVEVLDPDEHDVIYGGVSHLPHVVAYALMNAIGEMKTERHSSLLGFGGKGLLDYTRIASSDPDMWRDIFLANSRATLEQVRAFQKELDAMVAGIERGDGEYLKEAFASANRHRRRLQELKS